MAGICALGLYARTLAPGLTWAHSGSDGGDFLAAALTGGVPHPSGYPTYQLLLRAAIALFPGDPARMGNWLSAACAAGAVALLAALAQRMLAAWSRNGPAQVGLVATAAALTWAASPILWGQAVITEVYTLNALALVVLLMLLWRWHEATVAGQPDWPWLAGAGLTLGLGLGNHLSLGLILPGAAAWLWSGRREAGRSLAGSVLAAAVGLALGLSVYAYLPWAAAASPPINWEDPRTIQDFWRLVSGQIYRGLVFGVPWAYLPGRLAAWMSEALRQFGGPWGALLVLAGLWRIDRHDHAWWRATGLIVLAYSVYAVAYNTPDSFVYLIPAWCAAALWLAAGLDWLLDAVPAALSRRFGAGGKGSLASRTLSAALLALLLLVPVISAVRFWPENDLTREHEASQFVTEALASAAPRAVILTAGDDTTFALWYAVYGLGQRPDVAVVNVNLIMFDWYRRTLAERHPDLGAAMDNVSRPQLDRFLTAVAAERPLYRTDELNTALPGLVEERVGVLVRLSKPADK